MKRLSQATHTGSESGKTRPSFPPAASRVLPTTPHHLPSWYLCLRWHAFSRKSSEFQKSYMSSITPSETLRDFAQVFFFFNPHKIFLPIFQETLVLFLIFALQPTSPTLLSFSKCYRGTSCVSGTGLDIGKSRGNTHGSCLCGAVAWHDACGGVTSIWMGAPVTVGDLRGESLLTVKV